MEQETENWKEACKRQSISREDASVRADEYRCQLSEANVRIAQLEWANLKQHVEMCHMHELWQELQVILCIKPEADYHDLKTPLQMLQSQLSEAQTTLKKCQSVFEWVITHESKLPNTADGTPASYILDGIHGEILAALTARNQ
jgi:hypothetical protein